MTHGHKSTGLEQVRPALTIQFFCMFKGKQDKFIWSIGVQVCSKVSALNIFQICSNPGRNLTLTRYNIFFLIYILLHNYSYILFIQLKRLLPELPELLRYRQLPHRKSNCSHTSQSGRPCDTVPGACVDSWQRGHALWWQHHSSSKSDAQRLHLQHPKQRLPHDHKQRQEHKRICAYRREL